jgi:dipeptidyl aminopeptidase/acylaminoacyl peptidase
MKDVLPIQEKYERNGWPSLPRPDLKPPTGWNLSLITAQERIRSQRLSPDGHKIAFIKDTETLSDVYCMSVDGGWPERISTNRRQVAYWDDEIPQWSPDGAWLAFVLDGHVHIALARGGLPERVTDFTNSASSPRWMPDSHGLIVSVTRRDADQLLLTDITGAWPRPLTNSSAGDHWDAQPGLGGNKIAFSYRPFNDLNRLDICLIDLPSGEIRAVYGKPGVRTRDPRWSPDGQWIAFISQEAGNDDLWLVRPDGEGLHQVTKLGYAISQFAWHPQNPEILLIVNRAGTYDLALLELASESLTFLRSGSGVHSNPNWAPDGSFITFEYENSTTPPEIYRMELPGNTTRRLTYSIIPALAANKMVIPEQVSYKSFDGLEIPAFIYRPEKSNQAAILYPHGGPSAQYGYEWDVTAQYLVAKGYTFLAPNYRGSTGYGVEFEHTNYNDWGLGDTRDCLFGAKYLIGCLTRDAGIEPGKTGIDPGRVAIMGGSYGGYLANCSLARDPDYLFACGISRYGDANTLSSWALCRRELRLYTEIFLGHPARNRETYRLSSPINDVQNIQKPILLLHGLEDDVVPPQASEEWAQALRLHGKTYEYKTYSGEPHGFLRRETMLDALERIERFLDWYLLP